MIATKESWLLLSGCECCCHESCSASPALTIFMNLRIAKDYTTSRAMLQVINTALTVICWRFREELILSDATREAVESPPLEILKTCLLPPWATCTQWPCSGGGVGWDGLQRGLQRSLPTPAVLRFCTFSAFLQSYQQNTYFWWCYTESFWWRQLTHWPPRQQYLRNINSSTQYRSLCMNVAFAHKQQ